VSGDEVSVEAAGETVGEARWAALRELERQLGPVDRDAVRYTVLSEGERGLLGVGYEPARVIAAAPRRAARPAPAEARDEGETAAAVRELLEHVLGAMGIAGRIEIAEAEDELTATVSGPNIGLLIGRHGQTIDAVQYLANAALHRRFEHAPSIVVDAQDYRRRRERLLTDVALRAADRARREGVVELEPMVAAERKIVHLALKDVVDVRTESQGREPNRYVVVLAEGDGGST
jgi:spoIIIJ-associated protein